MNTSKTNAKYFAIAAAVLFSAIGFAGATDDPAQVPSDFDGGAGVLIAQMRCLNAGNSYGTTEFQECVLDRLNQTASDFEEGSLADIRRCKRQRGLEPGTKEYAQCIAEN